MTQTSTGGLSLGKCLLVSVASATMGAGAMLAGVSSRPEPEPVVVRASEACVEALDLAMEAIGYSAEAVEATKYTFGLEGKRELERLTKQVDMIGPVFRWKVRECRAH